MKKTILITGGAGFVGGNLAIRLKQAGHTVVVFDNLVRRGSEFNLEQFFIHEIPFVHGDIRNVEDFKKLTMTPDVVLECAAQPTAIDGFDNPMFDLTNNMYGLVNVLEFCRTSGAGLIFWNSNKAYSGDLCNSVPTIETDTRLTWVDEGEFSLRGWSNNGFSHELDVNGGGHTIYGASKLAADMLCQEWATAFDIPVIINRFSCLYGPGQFGKVSQGWVTWFIIAKEFGLPLVYCGFNGKQVRDYLHIDDVFTLIMKQINSIEQHRGSYYNVGGGINATISICELNEQLNKLMNTSTEIRIDTPRRFDQKIYISDITHVCHDFDWKPTVQLDDGLLQTIMWVKANRTRLKQLL